ncbi:MAG: hypothetical protein JWP87_74 [Labilithrix sp.]|nr:hypothetical protein [Labilithrix sp.]
MSARRFLSYLAPAVLPALLVACPGSAPDPEPAHEAQLVVGVQADDFGGLVESVHIVATVDGKVAHDETVAIGASNPTALPKEIVLQGTAGAKAEVVVEALTSQAATRGPGGATTPVVVRRAAAPLIPDAKKLLRIQLETRCVTFSAPGSTAPVAPACAAPQTCSAGRCIAEDVPFDQLEDYEPTWPSSPPDFCRPAQHGPPELILGTGQTDFAPLADGQTLQLERGPQGGHHIWIAARMKNLRQSGSRTTLTAKLVDDPSATIAPAAYVFTFDRDEGNYCKLWGLRFQLDSGAADLATTYKQFLGKKLEVTVEVIDSTNAKATSTKTIQLADKLLCPDGTTTSCNL